MFQQKIIMGALGQDPESINTKSGKTMAKFSVATTEKYKNNQGEWVQKTEWHNCLAFDAVASNILKYLSKGSKVHAVGKDQTNKYTDGDGNQRSSTVMICNSVTFLPAAKPADDSPSGIQPNKDFSADSSTKARATESRIEVEDDDLPF